MAVKFLFQSITVNVLAVFCFLYLKS